MGWGKKLRLHTGQDGGSEMAVSVTSPPRPRRTRLCLKRYEIFGGSQVHLILTHLRLYSKRKTGGQEMKVGQDGNKVK